MIVQAVPYTVCVDGAQRRVIEAPCPFCGEHAEARYPLPWELGGLVTGCDHLWTFEETTIVFRKET